MRSLLIFTITFNAFAMNTLTITSWFKLNRDNNNDMAAEVCFKLKPAPQQPVLAEIIIDKGTRAQGTYTTWVSKKGIVCKVVSTQRGQVHVEVENYKSINKSL